MTDPTPSTEALCGGNAVIRALAEMARHCCTAEPSPENDRVHDHFVALMTAARNQWDALVARTRELEAAWKTTVAAREEGRAEERKLIAAAVTDWAHSSGLRERPLLTVIEELESYRVRLEKSIRVATAAQDDAVDALATVTAERDEARRERDEYKACWHRDVAKGQAAEEKLRAERVEASAKWSASHAALVTERDAALAKLAALEEAVGTVPHPSAVWAPSGRTVDRIRAALSLAPSTALTERDARVRAEALGEAAKELEVRAEDNAATADQYTDPGDRDDQLWWLREARSKRAVVAWLRSLASRGGGA